MLSSGRFNSGKEKAGKRSEEVARSEFELRGRQFSEIKYLQMKVYFNLVDNDAVMFFLFLF